MDPSIAAHVFDLSGEHVISGGIMRAGSHLVRCNCLKVSCRPREQLGGHEVYGYEDTEYRQLL